MHTDAVFKIDLEICPTPLMLVAANGDIVRANKRLTTLFGYAVGELVGQKIEVLVPPEVREAHPDLRNAFFEYPTSRSMGTGRDLNGVCKDGQTIPVEVGLEPLTVSGETMAMVSVVDIRERKISEARIRHALDAAASAMVQVTSKGIIELVNRPAEVLFGYEASEMLGKPVEMLIPDRFRRKHAVYRASYQTTRETRSMGSGSALYGRRCDGSEFPVEIGLTPVTETPETSIMATIIDMTEVRRNERRIQQKNQQLSRLNTELLEFAYSASHDLKAPLATISGLLTFCKEDLDDGNIDEVVQNIGRAQERSTHLASRVEDILSLAKADLAADSWRDMSVRKCVEEVWSLLDSCGVTLTTDFQHEDPIRTVPAKIELVFQNLFSNAVKFRDQQQPEPQVVVQTHVNDNDLIVFVRDNGIGIPEEHHARVFRLFQRLGKDSIPGTGLGLPMTKKSVTQLGGVIELQNDEGWTVFKLTLPLDQEEL